MPKKTRYAGFQPHALTMAVALGLSMQAEAVSFTIGEFEGQFDSSLSVGASWALRGADPSNVGGFYGGEASSNTNDDGRLNFKKGETFSKIFKGLHDLELRYGDSGVFLRGKYWYDFELKDESRSLYDIRDDNRKQAAQSSGAQLLDAFVYHNYVIAGQPGTARLGKQVVSWGESTFIGNGLNSINPVDVAAFRRPGAEIKEGLIPVNLLYLSQGLSDNLSVEAFYQLEWDQTVVDNCGTFFGGDLVADGCDDRLEATLPGALGVRNTYLTRGADRDARDSGQFGVALRWTAEALNQTEFGLYALNYHSRAPFISGVAADNALVRPGTPGIDGKPRFASTGEYFLEYPEDIRLYGLSFSTSVGVTAVSGEVSYRPNMPLQLNGVDVTTAAFYGALANQVNSPLFASGHSSLAAGEAFHGYVRKPVSQAQLTLTHFFDQVWGADRLTLVGEAGYNHISGINDSALRFGRDGNYGNGQMPAGTNPLNGAALPANVSCTALLNTANPQNCNDKGFYTSSSWGYRGRAILEYSNVFANINLKPSVSWSHDVDGYGPNFNEGSKAISLGLDADYRNTYTASLTYTDFFGGEYNTSIDRDFVALSFGVSF
ncbi:DUF1302 domain-containing protein [Pseudomonas kunmingensis]|uniref:DUF1302 domain-containing protein n=1 Tax=Stutzerimonas kunmingensis TaxID=1211807 RepID=UPI0015E33724|nr:DUF1302 domain-containing protein [Stutzerimonas kunmingensis]MBA1239394.1 DUF1302 domain-containing protein [Stutzerimonas kunmingensis]